MALSKHAWETGGDHLGPTDLQQEPKESFPEKKVPPSHFHQT